MDSLPTGAARSWVIVAPIAFSPVIILFLADLPAAALTPKPRNRS
jgi:hypothetical protein